MITDNKINLGVNKCKQILFSTRDSRELLLQDANSISFKLHKLLEATALFLSMLWKRSAEGLAA